MNKILEGLEEALEVSKCAHDHLVIRQPDTKNPDKFTKYLCTKCGGIFYVPVTNGQLGGGE